MSGSYMFVLVAVFGTGTWIGRWLHRCVLRFPRHYTLRAQLSSVWREGDCRSCGTRESGLQQIPVIGWWMAGRCRNCQRKMDVRRPVVELLTGILLAALYWVEIPDFGNFVIQKSGLWTQEGPRGPEEIVDLWSLAVWLHLRYLLHAAMLCSLIVATVIDFELCIIPDGCTVPAIIFSVVFSFAVGQAWLVPLWFQDDSSAAEIRRLLPESWKGLIFEWNAVKFAIAHPHWHGLLVSVAGLIVGAGTTWLVGGIGFWTLKQEAMGDGDVVLMALIGAVMGWQPVVIVFAFAAMLALPVGIGTLMLRRDSAESHHFPYGPWLSLAALLLLLAWRPFWPNVKACFDFGPVLFVFGFAGFAGMAVMLWTIYMVKKMLGLTGPEFVTSDEWSSADHLSYYGAECPDEQTGQWRRTQWPGRRSGRGLLHYHNWRHPK
ncbi:MAG: prepilin peptidase [Planctomycetaceae bacterium]